MVGTYTASHRVNVQGEPVVRRTAGTNPLTRLWRDVSLRITSPIKAAFRDTEDHREIDMDNHRHKFFLYIIIIHAQRALNNNNLRSKLLSETRKIIERYTYSGCEANKK